MGSCRGRPLCLPAEGVGWTIGDGDRETRDESQEMRGWPEAGDYMRAFCVQAAMAQDTRQTGREELSEAGHARLQLSTFCSQLSLS
uniref:Uncharacterized protein n=1 Tax=Chlorobium phaeobacteroides (strain BS1) TaxID=331678 RepID=B3EKT7_CHLPB